MKRRVNGLFRLRNCRGRQTAKARLWARFESCEPSGTAAEPQCAIARLVTLHVAIF